MNYNISSSHKACLLACTGRPSTPSRRISRCPTSSQRQHEFRLVGTVSSPRRRRPPARRTAATRRRATNDRWRQLYPHRQPGQRSPQHLTRQRSAVSTSLLGVENGSRYRTWIDDLAGQVRRLRSTPTPRLRVSSHQLAGRPVALVPRHASRRPVTSPVRNIISYHVSLYIASGVRPPKASSQSLNFCCLPFSPALFPSLVRLLLPWPNRVSGSVVNRCRGTTDVNTFIDIFLTFGIPRFPEVRNVKFA